MIKATVIFLFRKKSKISAEIQSADSITFVRPTQAPNPTQDAPTTHQYVKLFLNLIPTFNQDRKSNRCLWT